MLNQLKKSFLFLLISALFLLLLAIAFNSYAKHSTTTKNTSTISPLSFGAKGDGITDDTKAIQKAFDLAKENNSVHISFPKGKFLINGVITIYDNTDVTLSADTVLIRGGAKTAMFRNGREGSKDYGSSNITFTGGTIDGNPNGSSRIKAYGLFGFHHAKNVIIKNMTFIDGMSDGHVFDLAGCDNVLIENCVFMGNIHNNSSRIYAEAIQIDVSSRPSFPSFGLYDGKMTKNVTIKDCSFIKNPNNPDSVAPNPIGQHAAWNTYAQNIIFENNYCEGWNYAAIRMINVDGLTIRNNTFIADENTAVYGIRIETRSDPYDYSTPNNPSKLDDLPIFPSKNINITNNTFKNFSFNNMYPTIDIFGKDTSEVQNVTITNNSFFDSSEKYMAIPITPINVQYGNNIEINDNIIEKIPDN